MWGPSFVDVLQDLWKFCTGRQVVVGRSGQELLDPSSLPYSNQPKQYVRSISDLEEGVTYSADHATTKAIRLKLVDYDAHLVQEGVLTNKEWLLYLVCIKNAAVPLLALHLTPLGRWHTTLKGQPDVTVGITPYTKSLMEWTDSDGVGCTAVVHKVTPEETVALSWVGAIQPGQHTTQMMEKGDWLELRPVFTTIA